MSINNQYFLVPQSVLSFLIDLTKPAKHETVLDINLDPNIVLPMINSLTGTTPDFIKSNPAPEELDKLQQTYDVIVCGPTFGASLDQEPGGSSEPNEEFWLKWSINRLNDHGRLAIIVPTGLLSNHSQQSMRNFILQEAGLQTIIELPSGWAQGTSTQASILFITAEKHPRENIKMVRINKTNTIRLEDLALHISNYETKQFPKTLGSIFTIERSRLTSLRLDAQYYDPKYTNYVVPDPNIFLETPLNKIVSIHSGERFSKEDFSPYGIPFLQVGNIDSNGTINLYSAKTLHPSTAIRSRSYSQMNDLLVTVAGTVGKVALLDKNIPGSGVCVDTSIRRLRIEDGTKILPEYLYHCLQSIQIQMQIKRHISGSVIPVLSSANLGEIKVYIPSLAKQQKIIDDIKKYIYQYRENLVTNFYNDFASTLNQTTTAQTPDKKDINRAKQAINENTKTSWKENTKTLLPFPIARAFSSLENSVNLSSSARLKELINLSETIVYYIHNILVADQLQSAKISDTELITKINTSLLSFSIDKRLEVIFYILKLARKNPDIHLFIPELVALDFGICQNIHNKVRNIYGHTNVSEPWCQRQIETFRPKLDTLVKSLDFLKDYKLIQIMQMSIAKKRYIHSITSMMGNNPLFQSQTEELETPLLAETQHVILISKNYEVLDVYPFYLLHAWESTGMQLHLCFLKQLMGNTPNQKLKIESAHGVGDITTETDMGLNDLLLGKNIY
ncbi:hypothetical protein KDH_66570 [Dictyobacter sp. S3.2.2.5]|uniref:Type I restriction modification DNA specificity domain-containing protein n=1 Tax=Dictyobacter halimunensis TaxID=3026934 RepID=A0ABQ6G1W0_9CHLR|nr:hypothetical protein KDH_66570 [Dictyobacter sp. S3.2.2.5]